MKLALAIFENRISPRFDVAPKMRVYKIEGKNIMHNRDIFCKEWPEMDRVWRLKDLGVDVLVCGAIAQNVRKILFNNGIIVIPWILGNAEDFLRKFTKHHTKLNMRKANKHQLLLENSKRNKKFKKGDEKEKADKKRNAEKNSLKGLSPRLTVRAKGGKHESNEQNKKTLQNLA